MVPDRENREQDHRSFDRVLVDNAMASGVTVGSLLESVNVPSSSSSEEEDEDGESAQEVTGDEEEEEASTEVKLDMVLPLINQPSLEGPVIINEFMASNGNTFEDEDGSYPDWIELQNTSPQDIDLRGWKLTNDESQVDQWTFPSVVIPSKAFLVVLASGKDKTFTKDDEHFILHTNFKLKSKGGYLGLQDPDGKVSFEYKSYPPQYEDVSFGKAGKQLSSFLTRGTEEKKQEGFTYLQNPTPNMRNSMKKLMGPALFDVTENPKERPKFNEDYKINATVYLSASNESPEVSLYYKIGFLLDTLVPMTPTGKVNSAGGIEYEATIGGENLRPGGMLRWYVTARDKDFQVSRSPEVRSMEDPQYHGTVASSTSEGRTNLPVMHFFAANALAATSEKGGVASIYYDNRFYDNVKTRRRGQTTMSWDKPKLKIDFKGKVFKFADDERKVEEFNLQSHFFEIGSQTYMREDLGSKVLLEAGVPTPIVFPLDLWMNGKFYGLYSFVEQIDDTFLKRNDLNTSGPLYKAWHIWKSNLRWDIDTEDMQWAYRKGNLKEVKALENKLGSYDDLKNFTLGLVGKGKEIDTWSRENYLFAHVDIPETINEMAAQNLIINQDRLTKNYYVYFNPDTEEWLRLPWDLEAAFGLSGKLGGEPSPHYCVLACDQFNSPLFGDSEHPQDIRDFFDGGRWNRKLNFLWSPPSYGSSSWGSSSSNKEKQWVCENPGSDGTGCFDDRSPRYADGTFNYLSDALLDVKSTREMYLRRLRTLMDHFMNGRLEQIITQHYEEIRPSAKVDNTIWKTGDIDEGYEQLLTEQLPLRREQLYETYGPEGTGLIPGPQKSRPKVEVVVIPRFDEIQIINREPEAVDISDWKLDGAAKFKFKPGTVITSNSKVVLCKDILKCKNTDRYITMHVLIQGPFSGSLAERDSKFLLTDNNDQLIHSL